MKKRMKIVIISDGTGETASGLTRAVMTQFSENDVYLTRYKNVRTAEQVESIFQEAALHHDLVIYTIVNEEIRTAVENQSSIKGVPILDIIGPAIKVFTQFFEKAPNQKPGLLYEVNDEYYKRMEAMEFTLSHDNGHDLSTLEEADIILVGVSRTSKTPLAVYLSQSGFKVVNIPLSLDNELPTELLKIDQRKIFALTIQAKALMAIREKRLAYSKESNLQSDYHKSDYVKKEIEWAANIYAKNERWPVFDVTNKTLEEISSEIKRLMAMRKENFDKQQR